MKTHRSEVLVYNHWAELLQRAAIIMEVGQLCAVIKLLHEKYIF